MISMFYRASLFNQDVSNFDTSKDTDMESMFEKATSFNQDLCAWQDRFPYNKALSIFTNSGCTYQDSPQAAQKGPFCASNCQSSSVVGCILFFYIHLYQHLFSTNIASASHPDNNY